MDASTADPTRPDPPMDGPMNYLRCPFHSGCKNMEHYLYVLAGDVGQSFNVEVEVEPAELYHIYIAFHVARDD
jgi:hypothetical protein